MARNSSNGFRNQETTGRYLILLDEKQVETGLSALAARAKVNVTRSAAMSADDIDADQPAPGQALYFDDLAVVVADVAPAERQGMQSLLSDSSAILAVEPERRVYATEIISVNPALELVDYLHGYRDSTNSIVTQLLSLGNSAALAGQDSESVSAQEIDVNAATWGLQVTQALDSPYSGKDIRVALLDTGFHLGHPDFVGRPIQSRSFVSGETVDDGHGHGTHVAGTACGPRQPGQGPRYGVAPNAEIYVGKVLSNQGSGSDGSILAGIEWAVRSGCAVICMSLGAQVGAGQGYSPIYEMIAQRALSQGTLIIAAAGNDSQRPDHVAPVNHPANVPSILAVAALTQDLDVARFSSGGVNQSGGQVDIAAPGVAVYSSWVAPTLYHTISGTSMATPHVAGIAALLAEANPGMRGASLGWLLLQSSRRLLLPAGDAGVGLVQAPTS